MSFPIAPVLPNGPSIFDTWPVFPKFPKSAPVFPKFPNMSLFTLAKLYIPAPPVLDILLDGFNPGFFLFPNTSP